MTGDTASRPDDGYLAAPAIQGDTAWDTTVGDVTIRIVLTYFGDGRWRAVYWNGKHALSCSDAPWHAPMPTGPHARYKAEMRADDHARWLCVSLGAVADPPKQSSAAHALERAYATAALVRRGAGRDRASSGCRGSRARAPRGHRVAPRGRAAAAGRPRRWPWRPAHARSALARLFAVHPAEGPR